jgi:hypothetical protein
MRSFFVSITSKLKYLFVGFAVLGLLRFYFDDPIFIHFWIIGALGFLLSFLPQIPALPIIFLQSLYMSIGVLYIYITKGFKVPSKENYVCKSEYILPFTGKWTIGNGGFNKKLSHSWGVLSQRYAYDFLIFSDEGKSLSGDNKSIQSYFCYGKDIISPADGEVVKIRKKRKDSYVDGKNIYCDTIDMRGNYIVIKHNDYEYSHIVHIMQNSIIVKVGDKVNQGQIIAKCGNSGNSSEPHIHFQLQSGKNFLTSATLPIIFSNIKTQPKANYELFDKRDCTDNLEIVENRTYVGRGLEVENIL